MNTAAPSDGELRWWIVCASLLLLACAAASARKAYGIWNAQINETDDIDDVLRKMSTQKDNILLQKNACDAIGEATTV